MIDDKDGSERSGAAEDETAARIAQVADQCNAICHMATAISDLHRDRQAVFLAGPPPDGMVNFWGEQTARFMQKLGDMLNAMDAVSDEDEWLDPIFAEAERLFPPRAAAPEEG